MTIKTGFLRFAMASAILFYGLLYASPPASAQTMTWHIRSMQKEAVSIEFYAQSRKFAWPGSKKAYVIRDKKTHKYKLNCRPKERICFGAWIRGNPNRYWGVGKQNRSGCKTCCYRCLGGVTRIQVLTKPVTRP